VRRWKNIPDPVRDAFVAMAAFCTQLAQATQTASVALQKKADATFVSEALAARASNEQLTELARFVQKDVMGRLDGPCAGHGTLQKTQMQLSSRMGALEAVVSAQDTLIQHLQRELHEVQKARAREGEAVSAAVRAHVEAALAQATAPLAAAQGRLEAALRAKAEMGGLELVVRDLHKLDAGLQARPTREEAAGIAEERASAAAAAATTSLRLSTQQTVDGCLHSINELRRAVESSGAGGGGEAGSPAPGGSSVSAASGPGGGFSGAAWKTKLAAVTAAFEGKLQASRGAVVEEAVRAVEGRLGEVVEALNKKAYKSDVAKALAGKADAADVEALLAGLAERGETAAALKRKADASELVAVKRALTDLGAAVLARSPAAPGTGGSGGSAAGAAAAVQASSAAATALRDEIASLRRQVEALEGRLAVALSSPALAAGTGGSSRFGGDLLGASGAAAPDAAKAGELVQGLREELQAQLQRHASSTHLLQRHVSQLQGDVAEVRGRQSRLRDELEGVAAQLAKRTTDTTDMPAADVADSEGSSPAARKHPHASGVQSQPSVPSKIRQPPPLEAAAGPPLPLAVPPSGVHGRWVWKSRCLDEATGSVLWDVEALNSAAEVLRWGGADSQHLAAASAAGGDDSTAAAGATAADPSLAAQVGGLRRSDVLAVRPGLYRVEFGFFAAQPPTLTILVNGHPAVSTAPQEAVLIAGPDGEESAGAADTSALQGSGDAGEGAVLKGTPPGGRRLGDRTDTPSSAPTTAVLVGAAVLHRHPAGSVAGVSLVQFLALPARAVVSLIHDGPVRGQGFLELAKL
jgi:hypothetical protein